MDRFRRIHEIIRLLTVSDRPVPTPKLLEALECGRHTLYRTIETAKSTLDAPIAYDENARGWRLMRKGQAVELPGIWFSPKDLLLLLTVLKLLRRLTPGIIKTEIEPFEAKLKQILKDEQMDPSSLVEHIRLLPMDDREVSAEVLQTCAQALTQQCRLHLRYKGRGREEETERSVSPQRLVCYRDNWYLDAFCHKQRALRIFSLDRIEEARLEKRASRQIPEKQLEAHYARSYGIFAGPATKTAVLRFTKERAKWVSAERWHPHQEGRYLKDGRYELKVPYGDPRELILDILRYGPDVQVVAPEGLRQAVAAFLASALQQYKEPSSRL